MKKICIICAIAATIVACNNNLEVLIESTINTLTISQNSFTFADNETAAQTVTVTTNALSWNATAADSWLATEKQGNTLRLIPTANTGTAQRMTSVTVTAGNAPSLVISVTQLGRTIITLEVNPTSFSFAANETTSKTATVTTNAAGWDATTTAEWLTVGTQGNTLRLTPKNENTGATQRTATVSVTAGTANPVVVTVTQEGNPAITYNTAEGTYWGNLWNNGNAAFTLDLFDNSNPNIGIRIFGFCTLPSNAANFRLDAGAYSVASTGAVRTIHPGTYDGDIHRPTCLFDFNTATYTLITGGTFTVALSGNTYTIAINFTGKDSKTNEVVNDIRINYTGTITFEDESEEEAPSFNDIVNSNYEATGTPLNAPGFTPAPSSWSGQVIPIEADQYYTITNWANDTHIWVDYIDGKLTLDLNNRIEEYTHSNGVIYDIYCGAVYQSGTSFNILTEYEIFYDKDSKTLDFSGTYNGNTVYVGFIGKEQGTNTWTRFVNTLVGNVKLVLTPVSSGSSTLAVNNILEHKKNMIPNRAPSGGNHRTGDESNLKKIPLSEMKLIKK